MRADVVVVGCGLAGLVCAGLLARRGARVVVVDRKPDVGARVHTTGIFVRKTLEDFDLPEDCLGPPVRRVRLISPRGRVQELASVYDEFRVGRMAELYRRLLRDAVACGAEAVLGVRYRGLEQGERGCTVRLDGPEGPREIEARLVIGADGARSRVAPDLGLDCNSRWIVGMEEVSACRVGDEARFDCYLDPALAPGYLAWVIEDGVERHVGVGGDAGRFSPVAAVKLLKHRAGLGVEGDSGGEYVERRGGLIPVNGVLRRIVSPRGLLVGDAAGAVSPLTAGGLDPAIRLSTLAAEVALEMLCGNSRAMTRYNGAAFASRFVSRRWMRWLLERAVSPAVVEAGCAVLRTCPGRALARHVFFGRGSFPEVGTETRRAAAGAAT